MIYFLCLDLILLNMDAKWHAGLCHILRKNNIDAEEFSIAISDLIQERCSLVLTGDRNDASIFVAMVCDSIMKRFCGTLYIDDVEKQIKLRHEDKDGCFSKEFICFKKVSMRNKRSDESVEEKVFVITQVPKVVANYVSSEMKLNYWDYLIEYATAWQRENANTQEENS